uniref:THUMP domain-containing protein n=1 Tax=Poecilia mexicana TaxID=48701 RepID=A0A3B3WYL7_9TELE
MPEVRSEDSVVRYYCTAGNGMEPFLVDEVKRKLAAQDVYQIPGKVLFSSSATIRRVCDLKAAERLFLLLKQDSPVRLSTHTSPGTTKAASVLQSRLLGDGTQMTWEKTLLWEAWRMVRMHRFVKSQLQSDDFWVMRNKPYLLFFSPVSFRINCKCSGKLHRCVSAQEVSRVMGIGLSRLLGWKADLKNPKLEINVYLNDDYCLLGIPLTRLLLPLANRSYLKTPGLRSTVAWAMASLALIEPGSCVVDPMCGVGTILIEAAKEHKAACFLGVDIDDGQLQKADENVVFAELQSRVHLLKASSTALPLPSASVDAVVCDLPFGRKFSTRINMAENLPVILSEMERVLRVGGTLVVLLSPQLSCLLKKLLLQTNCGPKRNAEAESQTGMKSCLASSSEQHNLQITSSSSQEASTFSSLRHQATLRVSLGVIDGLIHKYIKTLD